MPFITPKILNIRASLEYFTALYSLFSFLASLHKKEKTRAIDETCQP